MASLTCDLCGHVVHGRTLGYCRVPLAQHRARCALATPEQRAQRKPSGHWPVSAAGVSHREISRLASRKYTETHPPRKEPGRKRKWMLADPHKHKARKALRAAVKAGEIQKPTRCEDCGKKCEERRLHGHHHRGYDLPYDVRWLCPRCHGRAHRLPILTIPGHDALAARFGPSR